MLLAKRLLMVVALFSLGRLVATTVDLALLAGAGENEISVQHGFWILSGYPVGSAGDRV